MLTKSGYAGATFAKGRIHVRDMTVLKRCLVIGAGAQWRPRVRIPPFRQPSPSARLARGFGSAL